MSSSCLFECAPLWSQLLSDGISNGTSFLFWHILSHSAFTAADSRVMKKVESPVRHISYHQLIALGLSEGSYSKMTQGKGTTVFVFLLSEVAVNTYKMENSRIFIWMLKKIKKISFNFTVESRKWIFSKLGVCVQHSINEVGDSCLNMCLVYWVALVNMGSMLTGDMKVRKASFSAQFK